MIREEFKNPMESTTFVEFVVQLGQTIERRSDAETSSAMTQEGLVPMCAKRITPPFPDPNPSGLCMCGCGEATGVWRVSDISQERYRGYHPRWIRGHNRRLANIPDDPNPSGLCLCGCKRETAIWSESCTERNRYKGNHALYISGHNIKDQSKQIYVEEDRGYLTPCWIWQATLSRGYGQKKVRGKIFLVHRLV